MEEASMSQTAASQVGLRPTTTERRRLVAAAAASASPMPHTATKTNPGKSSTPGKSTPGKSPPGKTTPKVAAASAKSQSQKDNANGAEAAVAEGEEETGETSQWKARIKTLEENFQIMREEEEKMKAEILDLRDKLEEKVWAKSRLEEKVKDLTEKLKEVEKNSGGGGGVTQAVKSDIDRKMEERKKEIKEVEERLNARVKKVEEKSGKRQDGGGGGGAAAAGGGGEGGEVVQPKVRKKRCIVLTDSNGSQVTHHSIMNHVPREMRGEVSFDVVVAYTLDEAHRRIDRGEIRVEGATVIIDDLTNDVRGTRHRPAATPQQLVRLVDTLRRRVMAAGAEAVIVCQLKPMQVVDVTPFNELLNEYLRREKERGRDGYGCQTQIRLEHLKGDGYHIRPDFASVLDRTYACAFIGIDVPDPTPWDEFAPSFVRRRWEADWPRLVGGGTQMTHHV